MKFCKSFLVVVRKVAIMLFERVKLLSGKREKNIKTVALELGLSENYFYSWKTSSPKTEVLKKVADYFDVSLDYLTGRTDTPSITSDEQREQTIEEALNSVISYDGKPLTDNDREVLRRITEAYLDGKI